MSTITFKTIEDGTVVIVVMAKCGECEQEVEVDDYQGVRDHVDANPGHYFLSICK